MLKLLSCVGCVGIFIVRREFGSRSDALAYFFWKQSIRKCFFVQLQHEHQVLSPSLSPSLPLSL